MSVGSTLFPSSLPTHSLHLKAKQQDLDPRKADSCPGAPTATVLAFFNPSLHITVVDKSVPLIQRWNSHSCHLPLKDEPGLRYLVLITRDGALPSLFCTGCEDRMVERPARKPNLVFSSDVEGSVADADMVFICVQTPTKADKMEVDTAALEYAVTDVAVHGKDGVVVVVKSTVPVGMARVVSEMVRGFSKASVFKTVSPILLMRNLQVTKTRPQMSFEALFNPEFLSKGSVVI
jgi:UDPglucose 6-dehydrogenase